MSRSLDDRLAALRTMRSSGEGRIPAELVVAADVLLQRAEERRGRSPNFTVVGLFGATGSGKSSLLNALVGADVARTHVRRPTTSQALAVTWEANGAVELLDWLDVRERVVQERPIDPRAGQLVLLDLPDFDSVEQGNRAVAERLAGQVDALLWVVDPQKYADDVLHAQFIAPHARHAEVTLLVLNQIDLLAPSDVPHVVRSLREIAARDGIPKARVLSVSARTGDGIADLRTALGDLAAARSARDARLAADLATLAGRLPDPGAPSKIKQGALTRLRDDVAVAAGADTVAAAVASSYRKRSAQATGWPLVSWIARLRADPLRRLGLAVRGAQRDPAVHRTSMPPMSSAAEARLSLAVRGFADTASEGLTESWRAGVRSESERSLTALPDALDQALAGTPLPARGSWWWPIFTVVQWIALLAGLVGVGWLLAAALLPTFGFPPVEVPRIEGWAVPTLLIAGAVVLGILLGLLAALLSAVTAASRRRRTRQRLGKAIDGVVQRLVVEPVEAELQRARAFAAARATAGG
ncbi:MAG TPA: GTPase [Rhodoglobus sp.]|nr:GTPase [Rhodoglobus sp.]